jgi:ATP-binding cassette, subfamily B, bacterial
VLFRRLLKLARPYWLHTAGLFALSLLATPLALLQPLPLKIAVDSVIGKEPLPGWILAILPSSFIHSATAALVVAVVLLLSVEAVNQLSNLCTSVLRTYTTERLALLFRAQLLRHAQRLSLSYHDTQGTADAVYRIQWDANSIQYIVLDGVIPFITAACTFGGMLYVCLRLDMQLALIALGISPFLLLIARFRRSRLRPISREVKKLESSALSIAQEVMSTLRVVKAFG